MSNYETIMFFNLRFKVFFCNIFLTITHLLYLCKVQKRCVFAERFSNKFKHDWLPNVTIYALGLIIYSWLRSIYMYVL